MAKTDPYADFRAMTRDEQREHILTVCALCWDGAPKSLARKIEIYLEATPDDQKRRRDNAFDRRGE